VFGIKANRWHFALRIICAIALVSLSFAHQPLALAKGSSSNLSAYLLPDGSLPILCSSSGDGSKKGNGRTDTCEACRLATSIAVPLAPSFGQRLAAPVSAIPNQPKIILVKHQSFPPAAPPRAPPFS